jgi:hypothetical protein
MPTFPHLIGFKAVCPECKQETPLSATAFDYGVKVYHTHASDRTKLLEGWEIKYECEIKAIYERVGSE